MRTQPSLHIPTPKSAPVTPRSRISLCRARLCSGHPIGGDGAAMTDDSFTESHHGCALRLSSRPVSVLGVPRKSAAKQPELPFDVTSRSTGVVQETTTGVPKPARKMGRPRKWESEAERKRAYRERLADDLAEPQRLRRELRNANRRVADRDRRIGELERDLARAEAEIELGAERESDVHAVVERLEAQVDHWRSRAIELGNEVKTERARSARLVAPTPSGPNPTSRTNALPAGRPKSRSKKRRRQ